jgi:Circadian oscillating protein COP23
MKTFKANSKAFWQYVTLSGIFLSPAFLLPAPSYALPKTTFACINQNKDYVTVARRGDRQTPPMIIWKDTSFGAKYTPQARCKIVSQRLTKAVSSTGKLNSLDMTHGIVNSTPVICYITQKGDKCNSKNILFSLKASERGQEQQILAELLNFSKLGSGSPTERGTNLPGSDESGDTKETAITWGESIENAFSTPVDPSQPVNP